MRPTHENFQYPNYETNNGTFPNQTTISITMTPPKDTDEIPGFIDMIDSHIKYLKKQRKKLYKKFLTERR